MSRNFYFIARFRGNSILARTLIGARKWSDEIAEREGFRPSGPWSGDGDGLWSVVWSVRGYESSSGEYEYAEADINTVPIVKAEYESVEAAVHD